jgi:hypothetical protein
MVIRLGGVVLFILGAMLAIAGGALTLALLGRPIPAHSLVDDLRPYLAQIAARAGLPPGAGLPALAASPFGLIGLGGLAGGGLFALMGLWQFLTGQRSAGGVALIALVVAGVAAGVALR